MSTMASLVMTSSVLARPRDTTTEVGDRFPPGALRQSSGVACFEALGEPTGVALLREGHRCDPLGALLEAFLSGRLGEPRVHLGVLVGLAGDRRLEVVGGRADGLVGH